MSEIYNVILFGGEGNEKEEIYELGMKIYNEITVPLKRLEKEHKKVFDGKS